MLRKILGDVRTRDRQWVGEAKEARGMRRTWRRRGSSFELPFLGLGLLLIALGGVSEAQASCALPDAPTDYGFTSEQLAPNVFALYQPGFHVQPRGNVEVIEQSRSIVLVD